MPRYWPRFTREGFTNSVPPIDYLEWYIPRLQESRKQGSGGKRLAFQDRRKEDHKKCSPPLVRLIAQRMTRTEADRPSKFWRNTSLEGTRQ